MKTDYSMDKKKYSNNVSDGSPNDGENQTHFSGNTEGGRTASVGDSAGVADGLGSIKACEVKNLEHVTDNQRPKGRTDSDGPFTIGIL